MHQETQQILSSLRMLIGNTPLLQIELEFRGKRRKVFAKAEYYNLTGSIKDRMALHVLTKAYENEELQAGWPIVEATSGNTGISIAAIGRRLGHPIVIFMPDWMSEERKKLIKSFGAEVRLVSKAEGGFIGSIERSRLLVQELGRGFLPCQFSNYDNIDAHVQGTGLEISWQLRGIGEIPEAFIAGVGTGGTVMGVGKLLRSHYPDVRIFPLEPANSPTLSTGYKVGQHRIQGISDEFIPQIVDLKELDKVVSVDDGDSIIMAQRLAQELGLGVGISSGANLLGALKVQDEYGLDVVVTDFPDDNKKYLSTDLGKSITVQDHFMTPGIKLLGFQTIRRSCAVCGIESDRHCV